MHSRQTKQRTISQVIAAILLLAAAGPAWADALGTEFTYQGDLEKLGAPVTDTCGFQFSLLDAETAGAQVGSTISLSIDVIDGLFTADLDFGGGTFIGQALWLEISVCCPPDDCASPPTNYTPLDPLQPITAGPYALFAPSAGSVEWADVSNVPADIADGDDDALGDLACSTDQIARFNGGTGEWECADPPTGGGGGFVNMQVFGSSGTFAVPAGVTRVMVEVRGGGGGGGKGNAGGGTVGQGGSGGGYGKGIFTVTPGAMISVTVGAGGFGSNGGTCTVGAPGGSSSFAALISATGGGGGGGCGSSSTPGSSTAPLNMTGFKGDQYFNSTSTPENPGGACGDGSSIGRGGNGNAFFGRDGNDGNVVVFW